MDDFAEGVGVQPRRGHNVGSTLAFEEEGEPERDILASGRAECRRGTLVVPWLDGLDV